MRWAILAGMVLMLSSCIYMRPEYCKHLGEHEAWLMSQKKISMGMSEHGLVCSWGHPDRINESVGRWGVHKQYVYGRQYVYVENGEVEGWSN